MQTVKWDTNQLWDRNIIYNKNGKYDSNALKDIYFIHDFTNRIRNCVSQVIRETNDWVFNC